MAQKQPGPADCKPSAAAFLPFTESAAVLRQEMLETCERLRRAWLDRVQVEMELWIDFATSVASSKSPAEMLIAYADCVSRQIHMNAEDGRHLVSDCQEITQKIAKMVTEDARLTQEAIVAAAQSAAAAVASGRLTH